MHFFFFFLIFLSSLEMLHAVFIYVILQSYFPLYFPPFLIVQLNKIVFSIKAVLILVRVIRLTALK